MRKYLLLSLLFVNFAIFGQGFTIDSIITTMFIKKSGEVNVNEQIYTDFTQQKHGIFRLVPYVYAHNGNRYTTALSDVDVANTPFQISKEKGNVKIRMGDPNKKVIGKQNYSIKYTIDGPFIDSKEFQELYWNIVGNGWPTSIGYARATVEFEEDFTSNDLVVYTGSEGSKKMDGLVEKNGKFVTAYITKSLASGEGFTLAVKLPAGYIPTNKTMQVELPEAPKAPTPPVPISHQWPLAAMVLAPIIYLYDLRNKMKKQEDESYKNITAKPYPPLDLTPAEVGTFHDNVVHDRDVISLLPYWGYQGYLRMEYNPQIDDTYIIQIKPLDGERPDYEYMLWRSVFSYGTTVALSSIQYTFHNKNSQVKSMIYQELKDLAMYDENYRSIFKSWRMLLVGLVLIPIMIFAFFKGYWMVGAAAIIALVSTIILTTLAYKYTLKGQRVQQDLKGFYAFLRDKENYDFTEIINKDPKYFEKVFPYAVAFGLDKNFIRRISPYQTAGPMWYGMYGYPMYHPYSMGDFSETFSPKEITSAFTSYPESGGGGFSNGGGFSGGGFSGGGGGSW
jgi:uncharacterized membrane protein YgcG